MTPARRARANAIFESKTKAQRPAAKPKKPTQAELEIVPAAEPMAVRKGKPS